MMRMLSSLWDTVVWNVCKLFRVEPYNLKQEVYLRTISLGKKVEPS